MRALFPRMEPALFARLFDFGYQRNPGQAMGWYIVFLPLMILVAVVVSFVVAEARGATTQEDAVAVALEIGPMAMLVYLAVIGLLLIWRRHKDPLNVALIFAAILLACFMPALNAPTGLLPLAFLTTRPVLEE